MAMGEVRRRWGILGIVSFPKLYFIRVRETQTRAIGENYTTEDTG